MRQEFCEVDTVKEASDLCPWASVIVEVNGGFRAFEDLEAIELKSFREDSESRIWEYDDLKSL